MKISLDAAMTTAECAKRVDEIEVRLRTELPILKRIYIEIASPEDERRAALPA